MSLIGPRSGVGTPFRHSLAAVALCVTAWLLSCAPHLPPTTVPPLANPDLAPFQAALQSYVDRTQPDRKAAAQAGDRVPGQTAAAPNTEVGVRARQNALADALGSRIQPNAQPGHLIDPLAAKIIRGRIADAAAGSRRELLMEALAEQNDEGPNRATAPVIAVNQHAGAPRIPPLLLESLPALPPQLEYGFSGRTLLIRDVDADVIVDFLEDALPQAPLATAAAPAAGASRSAASFALPLPGLRGSTTFALMGDSGSGDVPQVQVADAMLAYFTTVRRFSFVLMLGDNLYSDDYTSEFLVPYKALLDRGVMFYAALGNHDRDLQIHFKPFNMQDRPYYVLDRGNVRFVALNSNHPSDAAQQKWLDETAFAGAGTKWRIAFFHHPLYSSGQHASESRDVIRPALEPVLVRNQVNVVFSGHEHLYERIAPQMGVRYFISGGGGRTLYQVRRSAFDEVATSQHHFMVVEIAGDRLFFQAVTHDHKLLDCGVLYRTSEANARPDKDADSWSQSCAAARPS